jgi:hypothetical protein
LKKAKQEPPLKETKKKLPAKIIHPTLPGLTGEENELEDYSFESDLDEEILKTKEPEKIAGETFENPEKIL